MESYAVARRIASINNELHLLNPSQELFANGVANLLGTISSAYPVSGSFSRSSLNQTVGTQPVIAPSQHTQSTLSAPSTYTPYQYAHQLTHPLNT